MSTMTADPAPAQSASPARATPGCDPATAAVVGMALLAVALQVLRLTRPGGLLPGNASDTSLYLGSAIRLVHGVAPYRGFVFLQPPGVVLLVSPFAMLSDLVGSRWALGAVNLCTPLLAAANVLLVGHLLRHRGWQAVLAGCGLMAVTPITYDALANGMLEPLMDLLCLVGLALVFDGDRLAGRRRMLLGGVAFGFGGCILVAAIVPVLVLAVLAALRQAKRLPPFAIGVAAGFIVPSIGFFSTAPGTFVHDTVLAQLSRASGTLRTPSIARLEDMTFGVGAVEAICAAAIMVGVIAVGFVLIRRRLTTLDVFALAGLVTMVAVQFAIANYYNHFASMVVPFAALPLGIAAGRLSQRWPRRVAAAVTAAVVLILISVVPRFAGDSAPQWQGEVDAVVPPGACALSSPYQLLVMSDRFTSDLPGCTSMVDPLATVVAYRHDPKGEEEAFQAALSHTDYLVTTTTLTHALWGSSLARVRSYVTDHFRLVRDGPVYVYVRHGFRVA
ncbi:MAG: hypothetical protein ACLQGJ_09795 [Candidatus Dormibacteria bacterium]